MGYGKVGVSKERMCSYKHTHNSAVHMVSVSDYMPFGSPMPNRTFSSSDYRYGLNGMERDNETKGNGNSYISHFRQYDPRLGRWMSDEPKPVAWESGYAAFRNNPVYYADPTGDWPKWLGGKGSKGGALRKAKKYQKANGGKVLHDKGNKIVSVDMQIDGGVASKVFEYGGGPSLSGILSSVGNFVKGAAIFAIDMAKNLIPNVLTHGGKESPNGTGPSGRDYNRNSIWPDINIDLDALQDLLAAFGIVVPTMNQNVKPSTYTTSQGYGPKIKDNQGNRQNNTIEKTKVTGRGFTEEEKPLLQNQNSQKVDNNIKQATHKSAHQKRIVVKIDTLQNDTFGNIVKLQIQILYSNGSKGYIQNHKLDITPEEK